MTEDDFWDEVDRLAVRSHVTLSGGLPPDRFCVEAHDGGWRVYYSERGGRVDEAWYPSRPLALAEVLRRLERDREHLVQPPSSGGAPRIDEPGDA